jgi:predicted transcriptional regulator
MSNENSDAANLLDILGNETRRRILHLLAEEPHYFIQISKNLGISQQAVLKHLDLLQKKGIIDSYREKSQLAAPERKYYRLKKSLYLSIGITEDNVNIRLNDIGQNQSDSMKGPEDEIYDDKKTQMSDDKDENLNSLLQSSYLLLKKIDRQIGEIEHNKISFLKMRQNVMKRIHDAIRSNFDNILERNILYSIIHSDTPLNIEFLSEQLDVREREIELCIDELKRRLSLPFK